MEERGFELAGQEAVEPDSNFVAVQAAGAAQTGACYMAVFAAVGQTEKRGNSTQTAVAAGKSPVWGVQTEQSFLEVDMALEAACSRPCIPQYS